MGSFAECEEVEELCNIVASGKHLLVAVREDVADMLYLTLESPLSSLKLALIAALSFCTTARSSAMVLEARTLRMNCFTIGCQLLVIEGYDIVG